MLAWLLLIAAHAADVRVAVTEFDNAADTDAYDALGKGLQAMVTTDLSQVDDLTVLERDRLEAVLGELSLQASDVVDPATAARAGKLLGATHVVSGTFTVVGDTMRLDGRLTDVETGEVVLAADAAGERAAFFELEKALVRDLLAALEAELSPKERAAIARIHTADFESFTEFSSGVALYDADRYAEAVATLERVAARDEDFKLARRTLEAYTALLEDIRAKSRALELTRAEQAFVARQEEARGEAAVVARLQAIARDEAATFEDRVTALYLLSLGLSPRASHGGFRELKRTEDTFALARAAEIAHARLYAEVRPRWPDLAPFRAGSLGSWFDGPDTFDEKFAYLRRKLLEERQRYDFASCHRIDGFFEEAAMLHLDVRERAAELDRLAVEGRECLGERDFLDARYEAAEVYASLLDFDRSTAILEELATQTDDTAWLRRIEYAVRDNREAAAVDPDEGAPTLREHMLLDRAGTGFRGAPSERWLAHARAGDTRALWELARLRRVGDWTFARPLWVGDTLAWVLPRPAKVAVSGPRTDPLRTSSIRYYGDAVPREDFGRLREPDPPEPLFVLLGAGPRRDFSLSLRLEHEPAPDWWPLQAPPPDDGGRPAISVGHPLVGVLFGVRDVDVDAVCDPGGTGMTSMPMRGHGVLLEGGRARLATVREVDPDWSEKRCSLFTDYVDAWAAETLDEARAPLPRRLEVRVAGTEVTLKADGATRRFTLPAETEGYVGLVVHGVGYVEITDLALE